MLLFTGSYVGSQAAVREFVHLGGQCNPKVLLRVEGTEGVSEEVPRHRWTKDRTLHAELFGRNCVILYNTLRCKETKFVCIHRRVLFLCKGCVPHVIFIE